MQAYIFPPKKTDPICILLGFVLLLLLFYPDTSIAQVERNLRLRAVTGNTARAARQSLPEGTRVAVLVRQTDQKDFAGSWARIRIRTGTNEVLPEDQPEDQRNFEIHLDSLNNGGRTHAGYAATSSSRQIYFLYGLTPDGTLYESVAWSSNRKRFESVFERVNRADMDMREVTDAGRIDRVMGMFFSGSAHGGENVAPPREEMLKDLTLEYVEETQDGPKVHLMPAGTRVVVFQQKADSLRTGYIFRALDEAEALEPEQQLSPAVYHRDTLTANGSRPGFTFPKTDQSNPYVYLIYGMTPEDQVFESVRRTPGGAIPVYDLMDDSFFQMARISDQDRVVRIQQAFFSTPIAAVAETTTPSSTSSFWMPALLGLLALGIVLTLFLVYRRKSSDKPLEMVGYNSSRDVLTRPPLPSDNNQIIRISRTGFQRKLKVFDVMDNAYFLNEIAPLIEDNEALQSKLEAYRVHIRDQVEKLYLQEEEEDTPPRALDS